MTHFLPVSKVRTLGVGCWGGFTTDHSADHIMCVPNLLRLAPLHLVLTSVSRGISSHDHVSSSSCSTGSRSRAVCSSWNCSSVQ